MLCYKTQQKRAQCLGTMKFLHLTPSGTTGGSIFPNLFGMFATPSGTFPVSNRATSPHTPWFPCAPFPVLFPWIYPQQQPQVVPTGTTDQAVIAPTVDNDAGDSEAGDDSGTWTLSSIS